MRSPPEFDLFFAVLRAEIASSDLLPARDADYLPMLADSLCFFLRRLSPLRLRRIFAEQARLPHGAPIAQRVVALLRHSPVLHKLGQVVARDRRLSSQLRQRLNQLESLAPRISATKAAAWLARNFKNLDKAGIKLARQPLAEGSVAVIVPFVWNQESQGVFKFLKPGIETRLEEDLEALLVLGSYLQEKCDEYHLPKINFEQTFETIQDLLLHEVRLAEEQENLAEAARTYGQLVVIPALLPFCSAKVTAMERLKGRKIPTRPQTQTRCLAEMAELAAQALVARPLSSKEAAPVFHADPHGGNLLILPEGKLGVLDWSLVGRLTESDRTALSHLVVAILTMDIPRLECVIPRLAQRIPDPSHVTDLLRCTLKELRWGAPFGFVWLNELLDQLTLRAGVQFHPNLLLFRKAVFTLRGVLSDLTGNDAAGGNLLDTVTAKEFLGQWPYELMKRWWVPFASGSPATLLSNADLVSLMWGGPAVFSRWWTQIGLDLLATA